MKDERGAVAIIVALCLTVLLGMGALVLDVGALFLERRELQNGADSAALAIAESCALELPACADNVAASEGYADANAMDGESDIAAIDVDLIDREVTVETSTSNADGSNEVKFGFAQVFGLDGTTVGATATAAWTAIGSGAALPISISPCMFNHYTSAGSVFDVAVVLQLKGSNPCDSQLSPGNWGWLNEPLSEPGACIIWAERRELPYAGDTTGANPECSQAELDALLGTEIMVPISGVSGTGNNAEFTLLGFAGFKITGFRLGGSLERNSPCTNPGRCIAGNFTRFLANDASFDPDAESFGISVVRLTK